MSTLANLPSREVIEAEILWWKAQFLRSDPLGFVQWAYPWRQPGALEKYDGPDEWQADFLRELEEQVRKRNFNGHTPVLPIRFTTASGHGKGKSVLVAFIVHWIMSTRPHSQGTVTANTYQQLNTRTWATIQTWTKRLATRDWFEVTGERMYHKQFKESWWKKTAKPLPASTRPDRPAFTSLTKPRRYQTRSTRLEGGSTDGEPPCYMFGNPTRSRGAFHRAIRSSAKPLDCTLDLFPHLQIQ